MFFCSKYKGFIYLLLITTSFLMVSCFDVVEEIDLKSNGSGRIKAIVNLSKSKTKVASLMKLGQIDGVKIPSEKELRTEVNKVSSVLKNTKGISNVHTTLDFTNYIGTISCDFTDISALNEFTKALSAQFKTSVSDYSRYSYNANTKTFTRTTKSNISDKKKLEKWTSDNKESIKDAFYTSIYKFDNSVLSQNNKQSKVSSNKKAVMFKSSIIDIINSKVDLSNTVKLN